MRVHLLLLPALAACEVPGLMCTEIGCQDQLTLIVSADGAPVTTFSGTITVGNLSFDVVCDGSDSTGSSPEVWCSGDGMVSVGAPSGGADATWSLAAAGYEGSGELTPEWTSDTPNGEGCPPTCWFATEDVELQPVE